MTLRRQLLLFPLVVLAIPATITIAVLYRSIAETFEQSLVLRQRDNVARAAQTMDEFLQTRAEELRVLSHDPMLLTSTHADISSYLARYVRFVPYSRAFYYTDQQGIIVAASSSDAIGRSLLVLFPALAADFQRAITSPPDALFATDLSDAGLLFLSGTPNRAGETDGVLVSEIDTAFLRALMQELDLDSHGDGATVVTLDGTPMLTAIDGDVRPVRHPDFSRADVRQAMAAGPRGAAVFRNAAGRDVITAFAQLRPLGDSATGGLVLMSSAAHDILMAPVRTRFLTLLAVAGAVSAGAITIAVVFLTRLSGRIVSLADMARAIGRAERPAAALAETDDEVGDVARAFREMASQIAARTAELARINDALGQENALRRRAEEEARAAHVELEHMLTHSPVILYRLRVAGAAVTPVAVTGSVERLLGITIEDATSDGWWESHLHPEDRERALASIQVTLATGSSRTEYRVRHADGHYLWIEDHRRLQYDDTGRPVEMIGVCVDVTERTLAALALQETEVRFRDLFENASDLIHGVGPDGRFVFVNPAWRAALGYSDVDLRDRTVFDILEPDQIEPCRAAFARLLAGESLALDTKMRSKDGRTIVLEGHAHGQHKDGQPIGVRAIFRDVTERKNNEAALQALHQQLLEASRRAGMAEVATSVLHDVGNVLNSLNVSAGRIADRIARLRVPGLDQLWRLLDAHAHDLPAFLSRDPRGREVPGYLRAAAAHLADPQRDLLPEVAALTRNIEHIRAIVSVQQTHARAAQVIETAALADLIEDAIQINAAGLARHAVDVRREFGLVPAIAIDRHKVLQILVNLISNAKYAIRAAGTGGGVIDIRLDHTPPALRVTITDSGVGIAAEHLTRIFQHGFSTRKDGHGFGLHSSALAARELGGTLTVRSDGPGRGACFTLELPTSAAPREGFATLVEATC